MISIKDKIMIAQSLNEQVWHLLEEVKQEIKKEKKKGGN